MLDVVGVCRGLAALVVKTFRHPRSRFSGTGGVLGARVVEVEAYHGASLYLSLTLFSISSR